MKEERIVVVLEGHQKVQNTMSTADTTLELAANSNIDHDAHPEYEADKVPSDPDARAIAIEHAQDEDNNGSVPAHPLPHLQKVFEESILESADMRATHHYHTLDVQARRQQLLEQDDLHKGYSSRWQQSPEAKFHPLWKIISQISFGVHLLHKREAKSDLEVVKILQTHIDEVDSFAEETTDDFDLAIKDIEERIDCLDIPLQHSHEFNRMLCNTTFRTSILQNNDVIERIMYRTKRAMDAALEDVKQGQAAVVELSRYLDKLAFSWPNDDIDLSAAFETMRGNAQGWYQCFDQLIERGLYLTNIMMTLQSTVDEMARRAGIASRRLTPTGLVGRKSNAPGLSKTSADSNTRKVALREKPLPAIPPPELPKEETDLKQSLAKAAHQKKLSLQLPQHVAAVQKTQQSSQLRRDSATCSPRYSTVAPLRIMTAAAVSPIVTRYSPIAELPTSQPVIPELPANQRRPPTPPRSLKRPSRSLSRDGMAVTTMDSAYASCPETPTFYPQRLASPDASPISSLNSTPKTSMCQARDSMHVAPLAVTKVPSPRGSASRKPSMTALPTFAKPKVQPVTLDNVARPMQEVRPLNVKKNHLEAVKGLFGRKENRLSLAATIRGGVF